MRAPPIGPPANPKPPPRPAKLLALTPTCPPKPPPLPPPPPGPASAASVIGGIVRSKIAVVTMPLIKRALADLAVFRPAPMSRTLKWRMSSPPSSIVSQLSLSVHCDKRKETDRLFVGAGRSLVRSMHCPIHYLVRVPSLRTRPPAALPAASTPKVLEPMRRQLGV